MIRYQSSLDGVTSAHLDGFFVGWPVPVSGNRLLDALRGSTRVVIAWDGERVVGFINVLTDGVLSAFVPLLEVRPDAQGRGVGRALVEKALASCNEVYAVDLVCDEGVAPFYERLGGQRLNAMAWRNRGVL